jgi:hypothetical protein
MFDKENELAIANFMKCGTVWFSNLIILNNCFDNEINQKDEPLNFSFYKLQHRSYFFT